MKIFVKANPSSKSKEVKQIGKNHFLVKVKEPRKEGRANRAIVKALATHLGVAHSCITLVSGFSSKQKVFEIS